MTTLTAPFDYQLLRQDGTAAWIVREDSAGVYLLRCDATGTVVETSVSFNAATGAITFASSSLTQTIGNASGSPTLQLSKSDTGTATIDFLSVGEARGRIQLDANENFVIQPPAGAASATGATVAIRGGLPGGGEGVGGPLNLQGANGATQTATSRAGSNINVTPGDGVSGGDSGMVRINGNFALVVPISPAALAAGDNPNYNPAGLANANALRLTPDAGGTSAISGIVPTAGGSSGAGGRMLLILNIGAQSLQLTHDATSTAANRIFCPNNANLAIPPNGSRWLWYDTTSSRWRVMGAVA